MTNQSKRSNLARISLLAHAVSACVLCACAMTGAADAGRATRDLWSVGDPHQPTKGYATPDGAARVPVASMSWLLIPGIAHRPALTEDNLAESIATTNERIAQLDKPTLLDIESIVPWGGPLEWRYLEGLDVEGHYVWLQSRGLDNEQVEHVARCGYYTRSAAIVQPLYLGRPWGGPDRASGWVARHTGLRNAKEIARATGKPLFGAINIRYAGTNKETQGTLIDEQTWLACARLIRAETDGLMIWGPPDEKTRRHAEALYTKLVRGEGTTESQ